MKFIRENSNRPHTEAIAAHMRVPLAECEKVFVEIHENVRGDDIFVVQSTSYPSNDDLMELLVLIDAHRRKSAGRGTALIRHFGYARQDRKLAPRAPISEKLMANMITQSVGDRFLTMDLHTGLTNGSSTSRLTISMRCRKSFGISNNNAAATNPVLLK